MKIKRVITGGCSFSDISAQNTWPCVLEERYPEISFRHTAMGSQGQELIQKNLCLAVYEELQKFDPEEIAVIAMWSGTERKAFYVDNPEFVKKVAVEWPNRGLYFHQQFVDLYGKIDPKTMEIAITDEKYSDKYTEYNPKGGWYHCNYLMPDSSLTDEYFRSIGSMVGPAIISLENIIMCQNFCKVNKVKIYHTFYRDYAFTDLEKNKDDCNLNYLYEMLDFDNIISTKGIYEHLRPFDQNNYSTMTFGGIFRHIYNITHNDETKKYFCSDDWHPNILGSAKWCDEVLIPGLTNKGFFE